MKIKNITKRFVVHVFLMVLPFISVCLFSFDFVNKSIAQSSDAIAIRVIPNPEHISALRWYKKQGFAGSPQAISVDGYEGVRDGRTVYVNVGNVSGGELYTNIYLISYNQQAANETLDVFSQILAHWKFNTNVSHEIKYIQQP